MSAFGSGWLEPKTEPIPAEVAERQRAAYEYATQAALEEFTFPVEDGTARVIGWADWSGREYTTILVTREDGTEYTSVRLSAHVEQARQRWEEERDGDS